MQVAAVVEAALALVGGEFGEAGFDVAEGEVVQAKGLHAGAVDDAALGVQVVELGVGGGVFAGVEHA